jgi:hypothetical protein
MERRCLGDYVQLCERMWFVPDTPAVSGVGVSLTQV